MKNFYLLTGPIQSGKTTRIINWIGNRHDVMGILAPVIENVRYLRDISSGEIRKLDADIDCGSDEIVAVGKYKFNKEVFAWGRSKLLDALYKNPRWLVIDEFGKLELKGEGLEPALTHVVEKAKKNENTDYLFIVRDYLVESFLDYYNIDTGKVTYFVDSE